MTISLKDEERLHSALLRQQGYIETVKNNQSLQFQRFMKEFGESQREILSGFDSTKRLSELNYKEFNKILKSFNDITSKEFVSYFDKVEKLMGETIYFHRTNSRIIHASIIEGISFRKKSDLPTDDDAIKVIVDNLTDGLSPVRGKSYITGKETAAELWGKFKNDINPANGLSAAEQNQKLIGGMHDKLTATLRQAYSNGWTFAELQDALTGQRTPMGNVSVDRWVKNAFDSAIHTTVQNLTQKSAAGIASGIYPYFQWASVLDNRTTEICVHNANRIFSYKNDSPPPAHYRCRSRDLPRMTKEGGRVDESESLADWMDDQPEEVQDDLLTKRDAVDLRSGDMSEQRRKRLEILKSLYPEALENKTGLMIK